MIVAVAFFSQYLPWAVNPKGLEFFYYYFPVACSALGRRWRWRSSAAARGRATGRRSASSSSPRLTFVFFLPVLSAQFPVDPDGFSGASGSIRWR